MTFAFTKMNGAGNDFVLADSRDGRWRFDAAQVARLCHRQRGIGADGLILWVPCTSGRAEWAWEFFNSDGSRAEMCGNGARCFARFVQRQTGAREQITWETLAGVITARFTGERVSVTLTEPRELRPDQVLEAAGGRWCVDSLDTGVPHAVVFVPEAETVPVQSLGTALRHHPHFAPRGTNVNFVQTLGPGRIRVRTYERGVEGETLACGTGVTAAALLAARRHGWTGPVEVRVQGGDTLTVEFTWQDGQFRHVRLTGPAEFVFEGRMELEPT